ncbi:MAG: hypothetical protein A3B25_01165 [Candidatus Ryanbacteria bacterium RIFCSPLOWO2_01_FULL_48_26]|uniref:Uncharacterized protein n=1 Tax=Candidatus Ryanbacteria bacterium RIFCSPLOWO2_01_FULL_48_26 TaxID=1802126 RepID=A0A1G2GSB2_9BACT|nr:MAG: hypothetical protein A3B25_01165 [Candidatus Ryanbacteria bacterium RIFCSPLOWO2_01_FULL_48_26]
MNSKTTLAVIAVIVVLAIGGYLIFGKKDVGAPAESAQATFDPLNATYTIEGQPVNLVDGKSEVSIAEGKLGAESGSAIKIITTLFGQPVTGDLNGDGKADAAVMIVENPGGTGTFFYVAAALNTENGAQGTNAVLLGDRIAPQNIQIKNGQIIANYADRRPDEPMAASPSVGVSAYLVFDGTALTASAPLSGAGEHCGGNLATAPVCITGYHCAPDPTSNLPFGDVGGICVLGTN